MRLIDLIAVLRGTLAQLTRVEGFKNLEGTQEAVDIILAREALKPMQKLFQWSQVRLNHLDGQTCGRRPFF